MPDAAARTLEVLAVELAEVVPTVDARAEHERWQPGIGPFEEDRQLEMLLEAVADSDHRLGSIEREVTYPDSGRRCDLVVGSVELPVEGKLLRFRRDNGNIDPNMYKSVFSPFPERRSSSLLTDARKLAESSLGPPAGLLGLYYEREDEPYEQLRADRLAEKLQQDVQFWYEFPVEIAAIEPFEGLRHPHHQQGAVIAWLLKD